MILIDIQFPRLQGIHTVAFMVYAENAWVNNLPMAYVDTEGDAACSPGHDGDIVPPRERALDLMSTPDYPPTILELEVSSTARAGDMLSVCVEMVGFAADREVFAWNARADIKIVG